MSPKPFLFCLLPVFLFDLPWESAACKGNMALQDPGIPEKHLCHQAEDAQPAWALG